MWYFFLVIFLVIVLRIYQHLKRRNEIFIKLGLPGPTPKFLFGNIREYAGAYPPIVLKRWTEKFGKIYGYYLGGSPVTVISDPDMINEIFVKHFSNFHGRQMPNALSPIQRDPDKAVNVNMFFARGNRWKRLRNITNPTFSTLKIKQMIPIIEECISELLNILEVSVKNNEPINIKNMYQRLSLDVIARTAFGYDISVQKNPNHILLEHSRKIFEGSSGVFIKYLSRLSILFPELIWMFRLIQRNSVRFRHVPAILIKDRMKQVIEERRKMKGSMAGMKDFIQLMLEAETTDDFQPDLQQYNAGAINTTNTQKKLSEDEIIEQSFVFIIAGTETTSQTLSFVSYFLASNPKVQEKLISEIEENNSREGLTYESVRKLTYLNMVIQETLRLCPPAAIVVDRRCMSACTVSGYEFPEGMNVTADVLTLHYSKTYWGDDADIFNPERFSQENSENRHPMVYLPFGAGPRTCIGMRFALTEAKFALVRILQKYKFIMSSDAQKVDNTLNPFSINIGNKVLLEKR